MTGNFRPGKTVVKGHSLHLSLALARSLARISSVALSLLHLSTTGWVRRGLLPPDSQAFFSGSKTAATIAQTPGNCNRPSRDHREGSLRSLKIVASGTRHSNRSSRGTVSTRHATCSRACKAARPNPRPNGIIIALSTLAWLAAQTVSRAVHYHHYLRRIN